MYLGLTILSLIEVIQFTILLAIFFCKKHQRKGKTAPAEPQADEVQGGPYYEQDDWKAADMPPPVVS